jgi:DNA polymerase V
MFTFCSIYQLGRTCVFSSTSEPTKLELVLYGYSVPAGFPSPADDHIEGKLDLNEHIIRHPASTFFARATGESMKDAGIFHGDLLVVDRSLTAQSNDIVIAVLHGDLTVKRLRKPNGDWVLAAANPLFPDLPINDAGCEVWGVVTHSIRHHCDR